MDDSLNELLLELDSRLPELQWKINRLDSIIPTSRITHGLFRCLEDRVGDSHIEEIKTDIQNLSKQKNLQCSYFLAEKLRQKVQVLVSLCQIESKKAPSEKKISFTISSLSTRQEWIQRLDGEIEKLIEQELAMTKALEQAKLNVGNVAILSLQAELGEVTRRLTLAKETLSQATS